MKRKKLVSLLLILFSTGSLFCATFWMLAPEQTKQQMLSDLARNNATPVNAQSLSVTQVVVPSDTTTTNLTTTSPEVVKTTTTTTTDTTTLKTVPTITPSITETTTTTTDVTRTLPTVDTTTKTSDVTTSASSSDTSLDSSGTSGATTSTTKYSLEPPRILIPVSGEVFSGDTAVFKLYVKDANLVEFFYRQINAGTEATKYLKQGKYVGDNIWFLELPTSSFPNGYYELIGRARMNAGGTLETSPVNFSVLAKLSPTASTNIATTDNSVTKSDIESNSSTTDSAVVVSDDDGDGIPNAEEVRLGTDPKVADSDGDGYLDGDEVKNGYNPLQASLGNKEDKILFQSPKEQGDANEKYIVEKVELVNVNNGDSQMLPEKLLKITGKALPDMFVTLYIYSEDPIIVTVKTDELGNWTYDLDKNIAEGEHEVYVAVTDNTGKITAKSNPLKFIKTAEAATVIPEAYAQEMDKNISPMEKSKNTFVSMAIAIVAIFLSIALILIGVVTYKHQSNEANNQSRG